MFHRHLTTSPNKMKSANVMLKAIFSIDSTEQKKTEEMMTKHFLTLVKHNFLITQRIEEKKDAKLAAVISIQQNNRN